MVFFHVREEEEDHGTVGFSLMLEMKRRSARRQEVMSGGPFAHHHASTVDHLFYNCSCPSACHGKLSRQLHKDKPTAAVKRDGLMMSSPSAWLSLLADGQEDIILLFFILLTSSPTMNRS